MLDDSDVVEVMRLCQQARVTIHLRGTDDRPVVEWKDRSFRRIVGGIELKRRLANAKISCAN